MHPPMRRLSPIATLIFTALTLVLLIAAGMEDDLSPFSWPGYSAVGYFDRELDIAHALQRHTPASEAVASVLGTLPAELQKQAVEAYQGVLTYWANLDPEAVDEEESAYVRAHLVVLLSEQGRYDEAQPLLEELAKQPGESRIFADLARTAYPALGLPEDAASRAEELPVLGWGWAARTVALRLRENHVDPIKFGLPSNPLVDQSTVVAEAANRLAAQLALFIITLGAAAWVWARGLLHPISSGTLIAPWTLWEALGVAVRGLVFGWVVYISILELWPFGAGADPVGLATVFLTGLLVLHRYLVPMRDWPDTFGFRLSPKGVAEAIWIGLAACAVVVAIELLWLLAAEELGRQPSWTETAWDFSGSPQPIDIVAMGFAAIVIGPCFEEILFRGGFYPALRRKLGPGLAALASGALFGAVHLYSITGFVSVAMSGAILALLYERTRSLLPCIVAHATMNAMWALGSLT